MTEFREIPSLGGRCSVSRDGKVVRNLYGKPKPLHVWSREGSPSYLRFYVEVRGRRKWVFVHTAVAEAWLGPKPEGMEVHHKNGYSMDNGADNLEYRRKLSHEEKLAAKSAGMELPKCRIMLTGIDGTREFQNCRKAVNWLNGKFPEKGEKRIRMLMARRAPEILGYSVNYVE